MPHVRRGGRPSREAAEKIGDLILDAATEMFLAHGFGATSIDAVAQRLRISKRTFYHRFADKETLFAAVVHRIVDRLRPAADVPLIEGADLRAILERLATMILQAAISPHAIALHRLVVAESARFPELAAVVARDGAIEEAVRLIGGLLEREATYGRRSMSPRLPPPVSADGDRVAATPRDGPGRANDDARDRAVAGRVVRLFLNGCLIADKK